MLVSWQLNSMQLTSESGGFISCESQRGNQCSFEIWTLAVRNLDICRLESWIFVDWRFGELEICRLEIFGSFWSDNFGIWDGCDCLALAI